jgi:hypothetical protein
VPEEPQPGEGHRRDQEDDGAAPLNGFLASLAGEWRLSRAIDDGSSMTGTATFTPDGDGRLDYREQGQFYLPDGRTLDAGRCYIFGETADGFAVFFAETPPRLFHRIALERLRPTLVGNGTHVCGNDSYASRYEFHADGSFVIAHNVSGPRKAYAMKTRYVRAFV